MSGTKVQCCMSHVQVTVPSLQSRSEHSATAFNLSPRLTEVTLFGGFSKWPQNYKSLADLTPIANTTVLRFGECTSCVLYCHVMRWKHRLLLCVMSQGCSSRGGELIIVSDYELASYPGSRIKGVGGKESLVHTVCACSRFSVSTNSAEFIECYTSEILFVSSL